MTTDWWPEISVDVVQGDLRSFGYQSNYSTESVASSEGEDEIEEWTIVPNPEGSSGPSQFHLWEELDGRTTAARRRIERIRFDICMGVFNALVLVKQLHPSPPHPIETPVKFCVESIMSDRSIPSSATSMDEYLAMVRQWNLVCVSVTPALSTHIVDAHQDQKDLQRDCVRINGEVLNGSVVGYPSILKQLSEAACGDTALATRSLSVANRTFSGGVSFDQVMRFFANEQLVFLAPDSTSAEPLDVVAGDNGVVHVKAHTRYSVFGEKDGRNLFSVDAFLIAEIHHVNTRASDSSSAAYVWLQRSELVCLKSCSGLRPHIHPR